MLDDNPSPHSKEWDKIVNSSYSMFKFIPFHTLSIGAPFMIDLFHNVSLIVHVIFKKLFHFFKIEIAMFFCQKMKWVQMFACLLPQTQACCSIQNIFCLFPLIPSYCYR